MVGNCAHVLRILLFIFAAWLLLPPATSMASGSWNAGSFTWGEDAIIQNVPLDANCHTTTKTIIGLASLPEVGSVCVYERPNFRYGVYRKEVIWYGMSFIQKHFVVSLGNDRNMYIVENMNADRLPIYVAGSNDLHLTSYISWGNNQELTYIKDFPSKLQRIAQFGQTLRYQLVNDAEQPFIPSTLAGTVVVGAVSASNNGRWMAAEVKGVGFVRIDTKTRELYGFSNYTHRYNQGADATIVFKISDDGTKIAAFDNNISPIIYLLDDSCELLAGTYSDDFIYSLRNNQCQTDGWRLYDALAQRFDYHRLRYSEASGFNSDGDTLYFDDIIEANQTLATIERKTLYSGDFVQENSVEYLALGDSFTSGEGDAEMKTDGSSYYLPGTESNNECHVSSRSYPFLLREQLNIAHERMKTVACSGAQILPDYVGDSNSYKGQGGRASSLQALELADKQNEALKNFKPGIVTQLEFVKKYQPKAITLMGGGNDVGFGSILEYCASPTWQGIFVDDTCGYAVEGHMLRTMLGQSIQSQYLYTMRLLQMIRQASPNTTVYVIGYPSFISDSTVAVCLNSAALNSDERTMIHQGVTTMNAMLEAAAGSMGVQYIDIQDALTGGRLCEGSEYVTGLNDLGVENVLNKNTRESFHPNASGHAKMAERMKAQNIHVQAGQNGPSLGEPIALDALTVFGADEQYTTLQQLISPNLVTEKSAMQVKLSPGSFEPGSTATVTMFSDTVLLGQITVNSNGEIDDIITLPDSVGPGRHVLVVEGTSSSGEPLRYYHFLTVLSEQSNDRDGDGIVDSNDLCMFIVSWIDETSNIDICARSGSSYEVDGENQAGPAGQETTQRTGGALVVIDDNSQGVDAPESIEANFDNNGDTKSSAAEVRGAHIVRAEPSDGLLLVIAGMVVSTFVGGYGILKAIRNRP